MSQQATALNEMFADLAVPQVHAVDLTNMTMMTVNTKGLLIRSTAVDYSMYWWPAAGLWRYANYPVEHGWADVGTSGVAVPDLIYKLGVEVIGQVMAQSWFQGSHARTYAEQAEYGAAFRSCEIYLETSVQQALAGPFAREASEHATAILSAFRQAIDSPGP